jgi:hypothetical protein
VAEIESKWLPKADNKEKQGLKIIYSVFINKGKKRFKTVVKVNRNNQSVDLSNLEAAKKELYKN